MVEEGGNIMRRLVASVILLFCLSPGYAHEPQAQDQAVLGAATWNNTKRSRIRRGRMGSARPQARAPWEGMDIGISFCNGRQGSS